MSEQKHEAAEVSLRLVVDSNAKEEAASVRKGLFGLSDWAKKQAKKVNVGMASNAKALGGLLLGAEAAVVAAGAAGAVAMAGLGIESAQAFLASEDQVRELAGTLTMIDQNGNPFEKLHSYAGELKDELEDVAMSAGLTDDATVAMFNDIVERGGKSVEAAKRLTEEMAIAGRAVKGGPQALAQGFEMLEMGMVRAKNPLVQLIASTGTLKGSAKSVAKQMQAMGVDQQMKLAEKAIGKMSSKMAAMPMTLGQMRTSMAVGVENLFETAGEPIVKAIEGPVAKVRQLFLDNSGYLEKGARKFGDLMARGLAIAEPILEELERAVRENWTDISGAIGAVYGEAKGVFDYLYKNRQAIAKTFVDVATVIAKAGAAIVRAIDYVGGKAKDYLKFLVKAGVAGQDAKGLLVDQTRESATDSLRGSVLGQTGLGMSDQSAEKKALHDKFVADLTDAGAKIAEAESAFDSAYLRAATDHQATMSEVGKYREASIYADADSFAKAWAVASRAQDEGAKEFTAGFLGQSKALAKTLAERGPELLGEGFDSLIEKLESMHSPIAEELRRGKRPNLGLEGKITLNQNFSGPITVKQDFRDQDPDRVGEVFRSDMAKYGTNRLQSRFGGPLGNW